MSKISLAQQTNPVERQVTNPITDTPSVNPLAQDETVLLPKKAKPVESGIGDELDYEANKQNVTGEEGKRIITLEGNVDIKYGIYRLQADKVIINEATNQVTATGSVVFDQGTDQRITGSKAEWNYRTKLGYFVDSTGFTNQTEDGTVIYFTADRVERTGLETLLVINGKLTACIDAVPKWSFTTKRVELKNNDRVRLKSPTFRILDKPVLKLPYVSIPIKKQDRASGFLTPTVSFSALKGLRTSVAYYQTLGKSADVTLRQDVYSRRGLGLGIDVRTRANSRSYFNFGFFGVKDRLFGKRKSAENPDQGGTQFYAEGVHYFPNGFTAAADVRLTSNLAFRQIFSDGVQQAISPIEVSQAFINKSWGSYSLNFLAGARVTTIPNVRIRTRQLPSVTVEKRPALLKFIKKLPVYFSWKGSLEGVSRREAVDNVAEYRRIAGGDPISSPALSQRLDLNPQVDIPLNFKGWTATATLGFRTTFYSNSLDRFRRVSGKDLIRGYGQFEFDLRPPALAKNFYRGKENKFAFRHVIEPYITYRRIKGVTNFERLVIVDYNDTITDTNEVEFGLTNRFYTRRYTTAVSKEAQKQLSKKPDINPLTIQPYEVFTVTVRGKYFIDETFGDSLVLGRRNQIAPITSLTAFTFGGVPRKFSPLNVDVTYRPQRTVFFNSRFDYGVRENQLRAISATVGYDTKLLKIFQTFYYTRAVTLAPSLARFATADGKEPGTRRGSQWSPTIFAGNRDKGIFGGTAMFFDFQNTRFNRTSPLISSITTLGYAFDCCAVVLQYSNYNVGLRRENRVLFSFRLNGIGTFGTEQFGQGLR